MMIQKKMSLFFKCLQCIFGIPIKTNLIMYMIVHFYQI